MASFHNIKIYNNDKLLKEYNNIKTISNGNTYFYIDNIKTTITKDKLIRENNVFKFELDFNNKTSTYLLKEHDILYDIKVLESEIIYKKDDIKISYLLESNDEKIIISIKKNNK